MRYSNDIDPEKTALFNNVSIIDCDQHCIATIKRPATIVTEIDDSFKFHTGDRTILSLFKVLQRRTVRLIKNKTTRRRLYPFLRKFVCNLVMHFRNSGELDDFTFTNIITALSLADSHSIASHGIMDHSNG